MNDLAKRLRTWAETTFGLSYKDEFELYLAWGVVQRKAVPRVKTWLAQFWNDPAYFTSLCRSLAYTLAAAILSGAIPIPAAIAGKAWWSALFLPSLALLFPAGQTNRTPTEVKNIAHDPNVFPSLPSDR